MICITPNSRIHIDEDKSITVYDLKKDNKVWTNNEFDTIECIIKIIDYECEIFQIERYTRITNYHSVKFLNKNWKDVSIITDSQKYKGDLWFIILKNNNPIFVGNDNEKIQVECNNYSTFFDLNKLKESSDYEKGEIIIKSLQK